MFEINELSEGIDLNILIYYYISKSASKYIVRFKGPLIVYTDIKNDQINLKKEETIQKKFKSELSEILKGNLNYKSKELKQVQQKI